MGPQWPWQILGTGLWTTSIALMAWGTFSSEMMAFAWGLFAAIGAAVVTAEIIMVAVVTRCGARVEHIAEIAAREALRSRDVSRLRT